MTFRSAFLECHSPIQTRMLNSKAIKWPTIAMAVNANATVQCTSSIGESFSLYFATKRSLSIPFSTSFAAMGADESLVHLRQRRIHSGNVRSDRMDFESRRSSERCQAHRHQSTSKHSKSARIAKRIVHLTGFNFQLKFKHLLYSGNAVLLELASPLRLDESAAVACLSDSPIDSSETCLSAGWFSSERKCDPKTFIVLPLNRISLAFSRPEARQLRDQFAVAGNPNREMQFNVRGIAAGRLDLHRERDGRVLLGKSAIDPQLSSSANRVFVL